MGEVLAMKALKPEAGSPEPTYKLDPLAHTFLSPEAHRQARLM